MTFLRIGTSNYNWLLNVLKSVKSSLQLVLFVAVLLVYLSACATYQANLPIPENGVSSPYEFNYIASRNPDLGDTFLILAFSGGGTRAAAMAYAALETLNSVKLSPDKSLLDEVNIITSVSGGSFVAAYYGLYGKEKFFRDFKREMLYRKMRSELLHRTLSPFNWPKLWSRLYSRSDLATEYYDEVLFHGATFADLPRKWPFIVINATDHTLGEQFLFTQDFFNLICSDLNRVKIARAVTASSAFPGAFPPLTFRNYSKIKCKPSKEELLKYTRNPEARENPFLATLVRRVLSYRDADKRPFIHVEDGGVSDNIGLRSVVPALVVRIWKSTNVKEKEEIKRVAVIIIDAKPPIDYTLDKFEGPPGLFYSLWKAGVTPLNNYSEDTVLWLKSYFRMTRILEDNYNAYMKECNISARFVCSGGNGRNREECINKHIEECDKRYRFWYRRKPPYPEFYFVHIRFDDIQARDSTGRLKNIPTDLQLDPQDVELIIKMTKDAFKQSPDFVRLLRDLRGKAAVHVDN